MKTKRWNEADIEVVRRLADEMQESDREIIMPGWDPACLSESDLDVRAAATAILGSLDPDSGVRISERALGALLRYVVDML